MSEASLDVMRRAGVTMEDIALVVPHQANLRIIDAVAKRAGAGPDKVFLTVQKYGNMSSATAPVALVEAVEEGRVRAGQPGADAGVRRRSDLVGASDALGRASDAARAKRRASCRRPARRALDIVNQIRAQKKLGEAEASRFQTVSFAENRAG